MNCIAKGKAHKPYEFGAKVSIVRTKNSKVIVGALAFEDNRYDGDTLPQALKQTEALTGKLPKVAIADRGYRGRSQVRTTTILTPKPPKKKDTLTTQRKMKQRFRKRAGVEGTISHLKLDFRLGRCFLKGIVGGQINTRLAAMAYNLKAWLRQAAALFFVLLAGALVASN